MFSLLTLLLAPSALAADLRCEAWVQPDGQEKTVLPMTVQSSDATSAVLVAEAGGYSFAVTADFARDVMYIDVEQGLPRAGILFVTAKMPTADVYQLTDLHLPGGPRLAVKCTALQPAP